LKCPRCMFPLSFIPAECFLCGLLVSSSIDGLSFKPHRKFNVSEFHSGQSVDCFTCSCQISNPLTCNRCSKFYCKDCFSLIETYWSRPPCCKFS
jgi:hypothetical protein